MPTSSTTPDWKLRAFHWLPIERWTIDNLLNQETFNGKRYCKVCDLYVSDSEKEGHISSHIAEEKARLERIRAEAAAQKEAEREWQKNESALLKEAEKLNRKGNQMSEATVAAPSNTSSNRGRKAQPVDPEVVSKLAVALANSDGLTLAQLSSVTGEDLAIVKATIKKMPKVGQVGTFKSGGRGRPAVVFGMEE